MRPPYASASPGFDPRSRARSDQLHPVPGDLHHVSIRAPVRGATGRKRYPLMGQFVSIRAPVRGATRGSYTSHRTALRFDPRSRARSDAATRARAWSWSRFRSALPCEERRVSTTGTASMSLFRSALPCEERLRKPPAAPASRSFDPRSRARSDWPDRVRRDESTWFRSALPCEERRSHSFCCNRHCIVSIRAPVRGATSVLTCGKPGMLFRSALPCEERPGTHEN